MPEVTTQFLDPAKTRYGIGDIVQLLPEPFGEGMHPFDFDMPSPFVMITAVETHTYNPDWVLEYVVRYLHDDDFHGDEIETIKPGKIARLILDAALVKRARRKCAREHAIKDPYKATTAFDRLYFARRAREERNSRTGLRMPECRPWYMISVEIVRAGREEKLHDCIASVEMTYGLGNPARAIYGVGTDGSVTCWAD